MILISVLGFYLTILLIKVGHYRADMLSKTHIWSLYTDDLLAKDVDFDGKIVIMNSEFLYAKVRPGYWRK